jgi:hypothetical protein
LQDSVIRAGTDASMKFQHVLVVSRQGRLKFETNSNDQNSNDPNKLKTKTGKMLKKI